MPKQIKQTRRKRRYKCQKCGEIAAVKHDKGRFRCLNCHSIYGENSRKTCYNKEEYLVFKALLQLFELKNEGSRKNTKYNLEEFTKIAKEQNVDQYKKLVEVNVINRLDEKVREKLLNTNIEDLLVITKDTKGRFQVYTKLFKSNERYDFKKDIVRVISGDKYHYTNCFWDLQKERNGDY